MLSDAQLDRSRRALYPDVTDAERARLPVSPLSICERALDLVFALNPNARVFVIGGDHSVAWPVSAALARHAADDLAIVQFDAHTDLLEERLGVRYCFATWSRHASRLLAAPDRMVQLGVRASRHDRAHWERDAGIVQVWAEECRADPRGVEERVIAQLERAGD
jgi:agmatinase